MIYYQTAIFDTFDEHLVLNFVIEITISAL